MPFGDVTEARNTQWLTDRDRAVLRGLAGNPLTAEQLLKYSQTFAEPFTSERYVRKRLQVPCGAARVRGFVYATTSRGALNYKLTALGLRLLNEPKAELPDERFFLPIPLAQQEHTRALADFVTPAGRSAQAGESASISLPH